MELEAYIRNNYDRLLKWSKETKTDCFRIYDQEIAEFPLAIDFYAGRFCIQYFSKNRQSQEPSPQLVEETVKALKTIFKANPNIIYWRTRAISRPTRQHEKFGVSKEFFVAHEYGAKFKINLLDYLDTGLFLDHRETRQLVASLAKGKRVLNLFSYTGSFTVHAALHGAIFSKSVDMSNTYCSWTLDNFKLNAISQKNHVIVREDCMKFLRNEVRTGLKYDIIIIDPPTISRSKKMEGMFDVQKDYIFLIKASLDLLKPNGTIFFSTNSRQFSFDESAFSNIVIKEITNQTIPQEFKDKSIHRCWKIGS